MSEDNPTSDWKCPHCGSDEGTWFDRTISVYPDGTQKGMTDVCCHCGKDVNEEPEQPLVLGEPDKTPSWVAGQDNIKQMVEALISAERLIDAANHLLRVYDTMKDVHDGKSDYLWGNLSNAANQYRALTMQAYSHGDERKVRGELEKWKGKI